jgi:hypothetical protein
MKKMKNYQRSGRFVALLALPVLAAALCAGCSSGPQPPKSLAAEKQALDPGPYPANIRAQDMKNSAAARAAAAVPAAPPAGALSGQTKSSQ